MMRVSWNKQLNPILKFFSRITSPAFTINRTIFVKRRPSRAYSNPEPIKIHVYYIGRIEDFANSEKIVISIPGGGFVTSPPPCHESYFNIWCSDTRVPIFSVDYKKAPEYPFPYAIEECYDLYKAVCDTRGRCLGLNGLKIYETRDAITAKKKHEIPISLVGDSSGGNILCGVMFKVLQNTKTALPHPKGIILIYPCLDFNISSWMTKHQVQVFKSQSVKSLKALTELKDHFKHESPLSTTNDTTQGKGWTKKKSISIGERVRTKSSDKITKSESYYAESNKKKQSQLTMTSRVSYFNDRILTPDMMRAMAILYIGPDNLPDFNRDYYLSPIVAPEELLAEFPITYLVCGEKDPFVDDTVLFGGRIRLAKKRMLRKSGIFSKPLSSENNKQRRSSIKKLEPLSKSTEGRESVDKIIDTNSVSSQNVKFSSDTKQSKFTIGDDSSDEKNSNSDNSDADVSSNEESSGISSSSSNVINNVTSEITNNIQSTDLLAPARSYARLFPMSSSQFNMDQTMSKSNERYGVDIKLLAGCSHGFLLMDPFLSEARGSIEFVSSWIKTILKE